jgi:UDP-GlcNAc3NAcA epimerase
MFDVALYYRDKARPPKALIASESPSGAFVLATVHRAENTDDAVRLSEILNGLGKCGMPVVMPLHPRTRAKVASRGVEVPKNILVISPVGYIEMMWLEFNASVVATDSGGMQKEAFFAGTPCVTLRDETEWVELVDLGVNVLVGADARRICEAIWSSEKRKNNQSPYGDGRAAEKIVRALLP